MFNRQGFRALEGVELFQELVCEMAHTDSFVGLKPPGLMLENNINHTQEELGFDDCCEGFWVCLVMMC